jgi:antitoxin MazE
MKAVQTQIVKIGNSRGVRIPKAFLDETGLSGAVEIAALKNRLVIRKAAGRRRGWEEQARLAAAEREDALLDDSIPSEWDRTEWKW